MKLSRNVLYAAVIVAAFALWVLSGVLFPTLESNKETAAVASPAAGPQSTHAEVKPAGVVAARYQPQPYVQTVRVTGRSEPLLAATLAAQTAGAVAAVLVDRGDVVTKGQKLLQIDVADRPTNLRAAQAEVKSAVAVAQTARELFESGFSAQTRLAQAEASLAAAQQALARIDQDIAYTSVLAPIAGVIEGRHIDVGDYVAVGNPVFDIVNREQFLIAGFVAQQDQALVQTGQAASATLANGQQVRGTVRFVATNADPLTRTYRVEILVDGAAYPIPTGMTADLELPVANIQAYKLPHAVLVLADDGTVGIKQVVKQTAQATTTEAVAKFIPVTVLTDTADGIWATGLPAEGIDIIVRGQAAVRDGSPIQVQAVE